ncbi:FG-GAP repeat protein [Aeromicrobium sp.]|uniref:FG-GAP repeat protein n=1 Tax=Aeromicrobium sp. TaxID=1871063 RepID=UPI002FCABC03
MRLIAAGSLMVGGLTLALASPASAAVCTSGVEGDVNGDGRAEVAVSEAGRSYGEGAVHIFYGRTSGLTAGASGTALDDQYIDQGSPGVAGTGADYDNFGSAVAFGDYNDDGCADLAVGADSDGTAGVIYVFYGSKTGLKTSGSARFTNEQVLGVPPITPPDPGFGSILTAADLNDDGKTDLGIAVPYAKVGADGLGTIAVLHGGAGGLDPADKTVLDRATAGVSANAYEVGKSMAVGDFDGNGVNEVAFGLDEGKLQIVEAGADGLVPSQGPLSGEDLGVDDFIPDHDGEGERWVFGDIIAAGDVDADGRDDLATGMPSKNLDLGGTVAVVKGSADGLTSAGVKTWDQSMTGVVGTPGEDDSFGASLAMGKLDAGPTDDLAIGVPYDTINGKLGAGSVIILLGGPTGLTTAGEGGARYHQDSSGVAGTAELQDVFGRAISIANVQSKTQGSLIIGAPREKIGTKNATGQFHQLSIMTGGPKTTGSVALNLDSSGVKGDSRKEAEFGRALSGS